MKGGGYVTDEYVGREVVVHLRDVGHRQILWAFKEST